MLPSTDLFAFWIPWPKCRSSVHLRRSSRVNRGFAGHERQLALDQRKRALGSGATAGVSRLSVMSARGHSNLRILCVYFYFDGSEAFQFRSASINVNINVVFRRMLQLSYWHSHEPAAGRVAASRSECFREFWGNWERRSQRPSLLISPQAAGWPEPFSIPGTARQNAPRGKIKYHP